jgi:GTPase Era involved in 16S rRNA processing
MEDWNKEQLEFIDKLSKVNQVFDNILEKDPKCLVITMEQRQKVNELSSKVQAILDKLKSKEFTVAVVGLEKAGKSTLGNAIIGCYALPEYTERCTYTTTKIMAGAEDKGTISFFTRDEFNCNFNGLLKTVEYPNTVEFDQLRTQTFDSYWESVESKNHTLHMVHNGTTAIDIHSIIDNVVDIKECIDSAPMEFKGSDALASQDFQAYITGIVGKDSNGAVIRKAYPYAVKEVEIYSAQLAKMDMSHVVLYDVPGFDSPTDLHKKQTENMLKKADAIILVTNVGDRPNVTGDQLNMIRKGFDNDGIKLSDKTFVFGNKIDRAGNKNQAEDNKAALRNDVVSKYSIAKYERVFFGSAKSFLEEHNIVSPDEKIRGSVNAGKILQEWELSNGIEELKKSLREYYANDRFKVLKTKSEKIIADAALMMHEIIDNFEPSNLYELNQQEANSLLIASIHGLDTFADNAKRIGDETLAEICKDNPFSKLIIDGIDEIFPYQSIDDSQYIKVKAEENVDTDNVPHLSDINANLRKRLQIQFIGNLVSKTASATRAKQKEIRNLIVNEFLKDMGMDDDNPYKEELRDSVSTLFNDILIKDGESCQFNPLIERFANSLIEALITHPFRTNDRVAKLRSALPEYRSLAVYYENPNNETPTLTDSQFCCKILTHQNLEQLESQKNERSLSKIIGSLNGTIDSDLGSLILDLDPKLKWAKTLAQNSVNLTDPICNALKNKLTKCKYSESWNVSNKAQKSKILDEAIEDFAKKYGGRSITRLDNELDEFNSINNGLGSPKTEEELIKFLNEDIEILRDITLHSVIKAIALERAFRSIILKNIELIRNSCRGKNTEYSIDKWIQKYNTKVRYREHSILKDKAMEDQTRLNIAQNIRELLEKID